MRQRILPLLCVLAGTGGCIEGERLIQLATMDDPTKADPRALAGIKGVKINSLPELTVEFGAR